jgi:hypothetical protein
VVKVKVPLPPDTAFGGDSESLWAEVTNDGLYRIRNVPFFAKGLSFGDVVRAKQEKGELIFRNVARRGGHSTYRIFASKGRQQLEVLALLEQLKGMHCTYEAATQNLLGIDVPPEANIREIYSALEEAERKGIIDFQEGHCGHPIDA